MTHEKQSAHSKVGQYHCQPVFPAKTKLVLTQRRASTSGRRVFGGELSGRGPNGYFSGKSRTGKGRHTAPTRRGARAFALTPCRYRGSNGAAPYYPYSRIFATTPAPTVRPPSRIAKRNPSSIAIGAINVTTIWILSPGITISVPSGNSTAPVTSVVRK